MDDIDIPLIVAVDIPRQNRKFKCSKRRAKPETYKTKTPKTVLEMYKKLNIFEIENHDDRAIMIVKYLASQKYRLKTALKYYEFVRRDGIIGESPIFLNKRIFDKIKSPQERIPPVENFKKCIEYLQEIIKANINTKMLCNQYMPMEMRQANLAFAVLFVYYTGLRSFEVCSITNKILHDLLQFEMVIDLERKCSSSWNVIYSRQFQIFLQLMKEFYSDFLEMYTTKNVILNLFNTSPRNLQYFLTQTYITVNKAQPPIGFGMHSIRYIIATNLAQSNKLEAAKLFLGHADVKTTHIYLKYYQIYPINRLREVVGKDPYYSKLLELLRE
jgi:integrase